MHCPLNTQCLLASYTVQCKYNILQQTRHNIERPISPAELGDFNPIEHQPGYLNNLQLLPEQSEDTERRISELHKLHRGLLPANAELNYLEHAKRLDFYGIDLHKATVSCFQKLYIQVIRLSQSDD